MLDRDTRAAILILARKGHGLRRIAEAVGVSRNSVKRVLKSGQADVPAMARDERLLPHLERIRELFAECKGNRVRVREELAAEGIEISYPALTSFCRRAGIGVKRKRRAGRYHFEPGEEMQHDTSPHDVKIGGRTQRVQCASLVLCYSRRLFAQVYPHWRRFEARVFLTEAIQYLGGAASKCMLDNLAVIIARGTGKDAIPAPEMKALADRFGFEFIAHEVGDTDRSARVERPFHHIENNFYAGRKFADLADLNAQLRVWCDENFRRFRRSLQASPADLYAMEASLLKPLPLHVPEVYTLHRRRVDIEGYVNLHTNKYSVDSEFIGHHLEVRETIDRLRFFVGHRLVETHEKLGHGARHRSTLEKHKGLSRRRLPTSKPIPQEALLRAQGDELGRFIDLLRQTHGGRATRGVLRLHRIWNEYPTDAVRKALTRALHYRLTDLNRVEQMVLRCVVGDFFQLPCDEDEDG